MCDQQIRAFCSIHCTDSTDELIQLKHSKTWETLQKAAEIREHILPINEIDCLPNFFYHRKCYQYFTMKSTLDRISKKKQEKKSALDCVILGLEEDYTFPTPTEDGIKTKRSKITTQILPKYCIFCRKNKFKLKISEPLTQCCDFRAMQSIKIAATQKNDFTILGILTQDLIAIEGHYHGSCYRKYTRPQKQSIDIDSEQHDSNYYTAELEAFKKVIIHLHELVQSPKLISFTSVRTLMEDSINDLGVEIRSSTNINLRRKIEEKVSDIKFLNVDDSLYLYPETLTIQSVITELVRTRNQLKKATEVVNEKSSQLGKGILFSAANIRKDIMEMTDNMPWPPQHFDLTPEKFEIPYSLDTFLCRLISPDSVLSTRALCLKLSMAQDIVYNITRGRIKTPKSILLPSMIKALTNSTELINIMNRLGHGIGYSTLMEAQTENAYQVFENQIVSGCILPVDCKKESFTIYVADNIDRTEETLSGNYGFVIFLFLFFLKLLTST